MWQLSLAVMASMLRTLRHGFLKDALDFAGVHRERLAEVNKNVFRFYVHVVSWAMSGFCFKKADLI